MSTITQGRPNLAATETVVTQTAVTSSVTETVVKPFHVEKPKPEILPVTDAMVAEYIGIFVNRRAFCVQSDKPGQNDRHYWHRKKHPDVSRWSYLEAKKRTPLGHKPDRDLIDELYDQRVEDLKLPDRYVMLDRDQIWTHLAGEQTINLYAINPETQCCKWLAIDADYDKKKAWEDLYKVKYDLKEDGVESVLERSRRGAHLWILCETPLPAKQCRIFIYNLALRLGVPIKTGDSEGIEIFPKQDRLDDGQMGNALRGPLGIHRAAMQRYWFEGPEDTLEAHFSYLRSVKRLTAEELEDLTREMRIPESFETHSQPMHAISFSPDDCLMVQALKAYMASTRHRGIGRNWVMQCPSCARAGRDRGRDNFAVNRKELYKYCCWSGCTADEIRAALNVPVRRPYDRFR